MPFRSPDPAAPGTVHVLDDDADLGAAVARMLTRQGFVATAFDDPAALLAGLTELIRKADVAAVLGIPATQVLLAPAIPGVQVYLGTDFMSGAAYGAGVALPEDIVNQTAGDSVCQQANPVLIVQD